MVELKTVITNLKLQVTNNAKQIYNSFEEKLETKIDEEQEQLINWMQMRKSKDLPNQALMYNMRQERDCFTAEQMLLQQNRRK